MIQKEVTGQKKVAEDFLIDIRGVLKHQDKGTGSLKTPLEAMNNAITSLKNIPEKDITEKIFYARKGAEGELKVRADIKGEGTNYTVSATYAGENLLNCRILQGEKLVYQQ